MADSNRLPYETLAGNLDAASTFKQLLEYLKLVEEDARALSDFRSHANDPSGALQWSAIAKNFHLTSRIVSKLAKDKTQTSVGYIGAKS